MNWNDKSILASQYKLYLPSEKQLLEEIKKEIYIEEIKNTES